jgi:hypothetical protein
VGFSQFGHYFSKESESRFLGRGSLSAYSFPGMTCHELLCFSMHGVATTMWTILIQLQPLRIILLVLRSGICSPLTLTAGQVDDYAQIAFLFSHGYTQTRMNSG